MRNLCTSAELVLVQLCSVLRCCTQYHKKLCPRCRRVRCARFASCGTCYFHEACNLGRPRGHVVTALTLPSAWRKTYLTNSHDQVTTNQQCSVASSCMTHEVRPLDSLGRSICFGSQVPCVCQLVGCQRGPWNLQCIVIYIKGAMDVSITLLSDGCQILTCNLM